MYDKYVTKYALEIANRTCNLADGLFHAHYLEQEYRHEIWEFLKKIGVVHPADNPKHYRLKDIEYDDYDSSLELMDCEQGFTLTSEQVTAIENLGFTTIFVNYEEGPHLYGNYTSAMNAMPVIKDDG